MHKVAPIVANGPPRSAEGVAIRSVWAAVGVANVFVKRMGYKYGEDQD